MRHLAAASLVLVAAAAQWLPAAHFDVLIRGGRVLDGTGATWILADVAVDDGRVASIGKNSTDTADKVIDAAGQIVAPGFIDVHTHADYDLYDLPLAENFIRDGVTTIVTGNCGSSPTDVADYFATLEEKGVAVNVATLYGHNTVLRKTKGPIAGELTEEQFAEAQRLVEKAMQDGAVGFSTGLIYTPGQWSTTEEIIALNRISAAYGGIYVSHMRSESTEIMEAIDEALRIGRETGSRVQISHFKMPSDVSRRVGTARASLAKVEAARAEGQEVWIDQYPYTASSTSLSTMLPDWVLEEGPDKSREILSDPAQEARILADMRDSHEINRQRKDLSYAVVASCRAMPEINGLNIKQVAQIFRLREKRGAEVDFRAIPEKKWPKVNMTDQYRAVIALQIAGGAGMVFHTMSEEDVEIIMASPLVSICSDSGVRRFGQGVPHPRGYGSNARVLGRYVRERNVIPIEEAIRKMTSMPALAFRLHDRGLLREGYWADIVVFDPATVIDKSTFEDPHHYSEGFRAVIVNGVPVVENDAVVGAKPGKPIRRRSTAAPASELSLRPSSDFPVSPSQVAGQPAVN